MTKEERVTDALSPGNGDALSPTHVIEINRACARFEAAWRAGRRPTAEDHIRDPDLASVRDAPALESLSEDVRGGWRSLWNNVASLLVRVEAQAIEAKEK
jgi:hypothetical protein